jgi:hypothetical protein
MAQKTDFTADEWKTILASPMLAGMAVTLAEPSGLWGMLQECQQRSDFAVKPPV